MATKALSANPVVVTSADTFTTTTDKVRLRGFFWDCSSGAAADTVVVQDNPGDGTNSNLWSATQLATVVPSFSIIYPGGGLQARGLKITPPTHGTLYVYLVDEHGGG